MHTAPAVNCGSMIKCYFIQSNITYFFITLATPINKFFSKHARIPLKEIIDMKIDRQKKTAKTYDAKQVNLTNVRSETAQVVSSSFTMNFKQ